MKKAIARKLIAIAAMSIACCAYAEKADKTNSDIKLPPPQTTGGMPLMDALSQRQSTREFSTTPLSHQQISDLLWAAFGVNRPDSDMRTAPSSYNWQDITMYVFTPDGVWTYDAVAHMLHHVKSGDHRKLAGMQSYVYEAPLSIVYVSDTTTMTVNGKTFDDDYEMMIGCLDAGHISQNVYLYCASAGLGAVARASVDREKFAEEFTLPATHNVIFGQTVGIPSNE